MSRFRPVCLALIAVLLSAACLLAQSSVHDQEPPRSSVPPQAQQPPPQEPEGEAVETFKAQVNVVSIFFNTKDKHGLLIPGLTKNDFEVLEDGKPQTIKYFAADSDQPLTLGILIDTSPSQTRVLTIEQESCVEFLKDVLRPKDLAFLINFDSDIDLDQDYTNNVASLKRALNKLQIGGGSAGGGPVGLGGGPVPNAHPRSTALYDAVYLAADEKLKNEVGRKAMIVFTDGEDEGSRLRIRDAIEAAQKADTICYVILIADRGGWYQGFGLGDMKKLAEETGGRVIEVGNNQQKLRAAFEQIQMELRSQYNIGYTPTNNKLDGSYRKIQIRTKNGDYKVQARQGYYAQARE
ncbi:MAG TPA: VWA domain-containing protein [Candidatus Bathyarchaeia archaeon]|nr:VWA domain-containing protein [Candidatus Bathyarchaeia archaeon]